MHGSPPSFTTLRRWARRVAVALLALGVVLACAGAVYQIVGRWRDARRFPQRGRSVQILVPALSGQPGKLTPVTLNLDCSGQGSPTVILDSGMSVPAMG